MAAVFRRLRQGAVEYGDASFTRAPAELLDEVLEELLDVCAWSYILAARVEGLRRALRAGGAR